MSLRRRAGALAVVMGTVCLVLGFAVRSASAVVPDRSGWWFRLAAAGIPLPLNNAVPAGGIAVQQSVDGPAAIGAFHYTVPAGSNVILTLTAAPGSTTLASTLAGCPTTSAWKATKGAGTWDQKPSYASGCSPGIVASDGSAAAFAFDHSLTVNGALDIAIVPTAGANPFSVIFEPPADDATTVQVPVTQSSTTTTSPPTTAVGASPSTTAPMVQGPATTAPPSFEQLPTTTAPTPTTLAPAAGPVSQPVLRFVGFGDPDRGARALSITGAIVLALGWWLLTTQPERVPRLLGVMASRSGAPAAEAKAAPTGGIGRFAKPRGERRPRTLR